VAVAFALFNLQERATLFIVTPGADVLRGHDRRRERRPDDMDVNVTKEKKLTNMRTTSSDENIKLEPPRK
jgi:GTP-binding protein